MEALRRKYLPTGAPAASPPTPPSCSPEAPRRRRRRSADRVSAAPFAAGEEERDKADDRLEDVLGSIVKQYSDARDSELRHINEIEQRAAEERVVGRDVTRASGWDALLEEQGRIDRSDEALLEATEAALSDAVLGAALGGTVGTRSVSSSMSAALGVAATGGWAAMEESKALTRQVAELAREMAADAESLAAAQADEVIRQRHKASAEHEGSPGLLAMAAEPRPQQLQAQAPVAAALGPAGAPEMVEAAERSLRGGAPASPPFRSPFSLLATARRPPPTVHRNQPSRSPAEQRRELLDDNVIVSFAGLELSGGDEGQVEPVIFVDDRPAVSGPGAPSLLLRGSAYEAAVASIRGGARTQPTFARVGDPGPW